MKKLVVYINGCYLKVDPRIAEVFTPGVFQGSGVFETMLAVGDKVFDVNLHLKRLNRAFKGAKINQAVIQRVVHLNRFNYSRVRILAWKQGEVKHVLIMALKYTPDQQGRKRVCLIQTDRAASKRFAHIKSLDYKLFADAYKLAQLKGFDEAFLINQRGFIFEASRCNVFWMKNGTLFTPTLSSGCLNGITRTKIIDYAKKLKLPFKEKNLTVKELVQADSIYISNSLIGMQQVDFYPEILSENVPSKIPSKP